ncbi:MAG: polysaccharide deacetylase 2 family uncharacterized protein YibQ [Flavobacteriales bacterium]|jgi:polysaccharide deacetylase 2 family uncharacterized protein YibQ
MTFIALASLTQLASAEDIAEIPEFRAMMTQAAISQAAITDVTSTPASAAQQTITQPNPAQQSLATPTKPYEIAIVIDDLGYQYQAALELAQIPFPLTLAVIPGTPHAQEASELTRRYQHELILHVPMQPMNRAKWEDGLGVNMQAPEFNQALAAMLDDFPNIVGINNHGGSLLTQDRERMDWVMTALSAKGLYFLDSRTTALSVAIEAAEAQQLHHASRDVFLDNDKSLEAINAQFERLRVIARKHGKAIAIGHPHRNTIKALKAQLPALVAEGFTLRFCSELTTAPSTNRVSQSL